jgi:hypothetical protein
MSKIANRIPSALKHGCYSGLALLPTEDRAAFDRLHRDLIAEYVPNGRSEEILIENLAYLMWRRQNLAIYGVAALARNRHDQIYAELAPPSVDWAIPLEPWAKNEETRSPEELSALRKQADERAQRELGSASELVAIGAVATADHLQKELELVDLLDGLIVRCLKRFLLVKGVKSIPASRSEEVRQPRITKAA